MLRPVKSALLYLAASVAVLYTIFLIGIYLNQEKLLFHPAKLDKDYKFAFDGRFEEIRIGASDGISLHGLLFRCEKPKGLIFYLHGNAGALDMWGGIATHYTDLGYDIFILDYRGFGKSEGAISSQRQLSADVSAAYGQLKRRYNEKNTVIIGYSIGTGPAALLASQNHPAALILQAPYYSLREFADSQVPLVPDFIKKYTFETHEFITKVSCPVFIFHGTHDEIIAYQNSVRLSKLLKKSDYFYTLKGQAHGGFNENPEFLAHLKSILEKLQKTNTTS